MKYKESQLILDKIGKAQKILLGCHRNPDPDTVGSNLAMYQVLSRMGKEVKVICPDNIFEDVKFLPKSEVVEKVDYKSFDYAQYDLFILIDSSSWDMATGNKELAQFDLPIAVIDHHLTNTGFGEINLVDKESVSAAEVVYNVFSDWGEEIDKDIAQCLLAGIIADTGIFGYPHIHSETLAIGKELMDKGADKDQIVEQIYRNIPFEKVKMWGEIISRMEMDVEHKFVWSAVPNEIFEQYGSPVSSKETAASLFSPVVGDTEWGMIIIEEEKGILSISFRSKGSFDVSKLAVELGGGGHLAAAGAKTMHISFEQGVKKILEVARNASK